MVDTYLLWTEEDYSTHDWVEFYGSVSKLLWSNAPKPPDMCAQMNTFIDANHAGDNLTCRSSTGVLIFLNRALVTWFIKKQNRVEGGIGYEFMSGIHSMKLIKSLRCKLSMMGVPLDGPDNC